VRYLIGSRKAAVNDMTEDGRTPLHVRALHFYLKNSYLTLCSSPPFDPRPKSVLSFFRRALNRGYVIPLDLISERPILAQSSSGN